MSWTAGELAIFRENDEIELASYRNDGTLRSFVVIWAVVLDDDVFIRSAYGADNPWYRRALESGVGRVRVGSVDTEVRFDHVGAVKGAALDAAYHAKYDRYRADVVATVVGEHAHPLTICLVRSAGGGAG